MDFFHNSMIEWHCDSSTGMRNVHGVSHDRGFISVQNTRRTPLQCWSVVLAGHDCVATAPSQHVGPSVH